MSWFNVDKTGLAAILERRGKAFALFELLQNAWDSGATEVDIILKPEPGVPYFALVVQDDGEGFSDLDHSFTMFAKSSRAANPQKRGRFNLGEKLVLAICRNAEILSTSGSIIFSADGTRKKMPSCKIEKGTTFKAQIKMTRDEYDEVAFALRKVIPPVPTHFNGELLGIMGKPLGRFEVKLPTELADAEGNMRKTVRSTQVDIYEATSGDAMICEMGIPIVENDTGYTVNVMQKIPMNMDRDNVPPSYLKAVNVAVLNQVHADLSPEQSSASWVQDAMGDSRAKPDTVKGVIVKRFGDRAVIGTPSDPIANANCAAAGYTVIPGGTLDAAAWANVRKHEVLLPSSKVMPTPKPEVLAGRNEEQEQRQSGRCPVCGK